MIYKKQLTGGFDLYLDNRFGFAEWFNRHNGMYLRSENTQGVDPFMRSFPNLLDIGIKGSCEHGKSGLCVQAGVQCYQNGLHTYEPDMSFREYRGIMHQCEGKVQQVALGGRGDPNKHRFFKSILEYTRLCGIVPNYTTSGLGLTNREVDWTKNLCGSVAVSWYRSRYTLEALDAFCSAGVTTNIHYVLSNSSIDEAIERLESRNFFGDGQNRINAVIFLLHKPVGQGQENEVLKYDDHRVKRFFGIVDTWNGDFKIGFDSCSIPGILNFTEKIDRNSIDTCEGARFSAYVTPGMIMTPCSFDQGLKYGVDLKESTIEEVWNSDKFNIFRDKLRYGCNECGACMGGCPLHPEIVLCKEKQNEG